jgi:hypothetical protein
MLGHVSLVTTACLVESILSDPQEPLRSQDNSHLGTVLSLSVVRDLSHSLYRGKLSVGPVPAKVRANDIGPGSGGGKPINPM